MIRRTILAAAAALVCMPASADFIDTTWTVTGFSGEAWFIDPDAVVGAEQSFDGGFAEGVFFGCDYAGQSSTYTTYTAEEFFANPEFALFDAVAAEIEAGASAVFVHRVTCEGGGDPAQRRVMYPLVTNDVREAAWYLFEGGVFSLSAAE